MNRVGDALLTLLGFLLLPLGLIAGAAVVVMTTLRRSNRLTPRGPLGPAPLTWLWSPGGAACLHRRLRSACQLAGSVAGPPPRRWLRDRRASGDSITVLAREVISEAQRLDRQLVTTHLSQRGIARAHALASLDYEVRGVEDAARRVHHLATRRAQLAGGSAHALSLHDRISSMEDAFGELQPRS